MGRLEHELADVLWSVIVLANRCGVDLEQAFLRTMSEIESSLEQP
jgi:NTP pyrophosphatase (non-canonical NTP hydrolase)